VAGWRDQHQRVAEKIRQGDALGRMGQVHNAQVGTAFKQRQRNVGAAAFFQVYAYQWVGAGKGFQQARQHFQQGRRIGQHTHMALQAVAVVVQVHGQPVGASQQFAAALHQHVAGRRQLHAAR
jgi:hypothetical protein